MERHAKNHGSGLLSAPLSRSLIPPNSRTINAVSTFKVKSTDNPSVWDLYYRMSGNGSKKIEGISFDISYSPTSTHTSLLIILAIAVALHLQLFSFDISNVYQCTPKEESKECPPLFLTMPPYYIGWFKLEFPHVKIEYPPPYIVKVFNYIQGTKNAGNRYFAVLTGLFEKLNLRSTSVNHRVFICVDETTKDILIVLSNFDDCLVFSSN